MQQYNITVHNTQSDSTSAYRPTSHLRCGHKEIHKKQLQMLEIQLYLSDKYGAYTACSSSRVMTLHAQLYYRFRKAEMILPLGIKHFWREDTQMNSSSSACFILFV